MRYSFLNVAIGEAVAAAERAEIPVAGCSYRQLGVQLWGNGAYERETIDGSQTRYNTLSRVEAGDIVVNKIWARNGSVAVVPEKLAGCYVSTEFPTFLPKPDKLLPRWFHWITKTRPFWEQCDEKSRGTSGQNRIRPEKFLEIPIPLPPLEEQRRIVARIEELAAKIEEARGLRRGAELGMSHLRNTTFQKVFTEDLPRRRLIEICSLITDGTHQTPHYVDEGAMFLSAQNVKPYRFMPAKHRKVSIEDYHAYVSHAKPARGDILLTRVGAGIGEAAMIDQDLEFAIYVSLALLKPLPEFVFAPYLVHWLNSPQGNAKSKGAVLGKGHSQGNLNLKLIRDFEVPLPSLAEQRRIVAYLDHLQAKVDALKQLQAETAAELDALLPSVLDRAFRGAL